MKVIWNVVISENPEATVLAWTADIKTGTSSFPTLPYRFIRMIEEPHQTAPASTRRIAKWKATAEIEVQQPFFEWLLSI